MRTWFSLALTLVLALGVAPWGAVAQRADMTTMERPIDAPDVVWMEELTVLEIRDAIRDGKTTVLVLTGGVEQNGPYMVTGKHNFVLSATGEAVARRLGNALVAPIVTLEPCNPETSARSPGTICLTQETYRAVLRDMATSLRTQGFTDIVMLGDSGGNTNGMRDVAAELNQLWGGQGARVHHVDEYYREDIWSCEFVKNELGIVQQPDECSATRDLYHDDYHYSSIVATTDPQRIRAEQRMRAGLFSINGVDLAPLERTIENGRRLIDYRAEITVRAIRSAMTAAR